MNIKTRDFQTWNDLLDFANLELGEGKYFARSSHKDGREDWTGTKDFATALTLGRNGWREGAAKCEKLSNALVGKVMSKIEVAEPYFDVADAVYWDIARVVEGIPECAMRLDFDLIDGPGQKHVRIFYNATASCGIDSDVMLAKGACVVALAQCLEVAGVSTEIVVSVICTQSGDTAYNCMSRVKRFGETFDIGNLAFAIAHPSNLRRIGFACLENEGKEFHAKLGHGYGYCGEPAGFSPGTEPDIHVKSAAYGDPSFSDLDACEAWVIKTLTEQGISLG